MRFQPSSGYVSDDVVQTPPVLARRLVRHFRPSGRILEPCKGTGNFLQALPEGTEWCEISEGRDFLAWTGKVDWVITNPPWSNVRAFLVHSMQISDNVVFLITVNHVWTSARIRDVRKAGFGLSEIVLMDMPSTFPKSGFQLGAIYWKRNYTGPVILTDWSKQAMSKE